MDEFTIIQSFPVCVDLDHAISGNSNFVAYLVFYYFFGNIAQ